jgi:hypothetical protein
MGAPQLGQFIATEFCQNQDIEVFNSVFDRRAAD